MEKRWRDWGFTRCLTLQKTKQVQEGLRRRVIVIEKLHKRVWSLVWDCSERRGGGTQEAGSRCSGALVRPRCFSTQDLCHPRHLSLLTVLLCSSSRGSTQFLFSFISSKLISALADKARHCAPLELSAVKLNYEPWNAGFLQKLVIGTFRCIFHFLCIYSKSDWMVIVQM